MSPAEAQTANSSPGDACRWLMGRAAVCYPWRSPRASLFSLQAGWRSLLVSKTFPIVLEGAL